MKIKIHYIGSYPPLIVNVKSQAAQAVLETLKYPEPDYKNSAEWQYLKAYVKRVSRLHKRPAEWFYMYQVRPNGRFGWCYFSH